MKQTILIGVVALALTAVVSNDVQADPPQTAVCNQIIAEGMRPAQHIMSMNGDTGALCMEFSALFVEFAMEGCFDIFTELKGLGNQAALQPNGPDAGALKHVGEVVCNSVLVCGLCGPALASNVCVDTCAAPL